MKGKYKILFKTGDAEIRALEKSNFDSNILFPLIELTRGRKSKNDQIGLINKRVRRVSQIFNGIKVGIDLTADDSLSNKEIEDLYHFKDGYANWISFLEDLNNYEFDQICPTILVNTTDPDLNSNLLLQVQELSSRFQTILYRNNLTDDGYLEDLDVIKDVFNNNEEINFEFIFDCEYVPSGATLATIDLIKARINKIQKIIPKTNFTVISTSFPRYVSDIGNDENDIFPINEHRIFQEIKKDHDQICYGDYGSINPVRNDTVVMARGWIPRIDVPTLKGIYYYRLRRNGSEYSSTYTKVARKVVKDPNFPHMINNWGYKQIISAKDGHSPGASPSFWISVRMSMFIQMQLNNFSILTK